MKKRHKARPETAAYEQLDRLTEAIFEKRQLLLLAQSLSRSL